MSYDSLPSEVDITTLSAADLLDEFATAWSWMDNCGTAKAALAWEKREKQARKELVRRLQD